MHERIVKRTAEREAERAAAKERERKAIWKTSTALSAESAKGGRVASSRKSRRSPKDLAPPDETSVLSLTEPSGDGNGDSLLTTADWAPLTNAVFPGFEDGESFADDGEEFESAKGGSEKGGAKKGRSKKRGSKADESVKFESEESGSEAEEAEEFASEEDESKGFETEAVDYEEFESEEFETEADDSDTDESYAEYASDDASYAGAQEIPPGALFSDDKGRMPLGARLAICRLLMGPYIDRQTQKGRELWRDLIKYQSAIESWLGEIFLELAIDKDQGVAFISQIRHAELPEGVPKLIRRKKINFLESVLLIFLRQKFFESETQGERPVVTESEMIEYLKNYESKDSTDSAKVMDRIRTTIASIQQKYYLLKKTRSYAESYHISPTLKLIISPETIEMFMETYKAVEEARLETLKKTARRRGGVMAETAEETGRTSPGPKSGQAADESPKSPLAKPDSSGIDLSDEKGRGASAEDFDDDAPVVEADDESDAGFEDDEYSDKFSDDDDDEDDYYSEDDEEDEG
ncbi:MAG: DUF4194 domain-containing protein [Deltaproteobacteria bacterium]|nr:DUF4194 domain-containing protein [Deltaproteobacteria bacterium]